nr:rubredoxin [Pseudoramibacter porci]
MVQELLAGEETPEQPAKSESKVYVCNVCGWTYDEAKGDPEHGIAPGTKWEDLPDDFKCPVCGAPKSDFSVQ